MMVTFRKVGVLYGGRSAERDVSLMSGQAVCDALLSQGINAHLFDTGKKSLAELVAQNFDAVFIALHGRFGEDGTLQGALELMGIPYTGSGPMASSLAMDKIMTKRLWLELGLPTPAYREIKTASDLDGIEQVIGLPFIMKPPHEGSTLGLFKVQQASEIQAAYNKTHQFDEIVLAEQFLPGREFTVALLGASPLNKKHQEEVVALPVIEIVAPGGNYDYEHKYFSDDTQYICPANISEQLSEQMKQLSVQAFTTLRCEGWARADIMLDANDKPWLIEINTSPGMTSHSLVPMAAKADGMSFEQLCVHILSQARCKVGHLNRTLVGEGK
jgi:D-alanine-D-alanine ligase